MVWIEDQARRTSSYASGSQRKLIVETSELSSEQYCHCRLGKSTYYLGMSRNRRIKSESEVVQNAGEVISCVALVVAIVGLITIMFAG
jgi:hypothetical protein